ncbi:MAG: hypothetical protein ACKVW3_01440 [Phycisphaerales bacterium]
MVAAANNLLHVGLYAPAEAARLVRAKPEAVARWVHGTARGRHVINAQLSALPSRTLTFRDLVQVLRIRNLRFRVRSVPVQKIREAVRIAARDYGIEHFLANRCPLFAMGSDIGIRLPDGRNVTLTRPHRHQIVFPQVIEPFLEEITFDDSGYATQWEPLRRGDFVVQLHPARRFGQPTVWPGGMLVDALADAASAEGSIDAAADAFETHSDAVRLALKYQDMVSGLVA